MTIQSSERAVSDSAENIVREATRLFAERGFHGVTTREIAAAVGINIATMHYHVGSKRDLYTQVARRLYEQEHDLISSILAQIDDVVVQQPSTFLAILTQLIDQFVDLMRQHPERPRLYVRRWLEWADDPNPVESETSLALFGLLRSTLQRAQQAGVVRTDLALDTFLLSFSWMIYGYFITGPIDWQNWHGDPHQPESLAEFRQFLHEYVHRIIAP